MLESKWRIDLRHIKDLIDSDYLFLLDLHKKNVVFLLITGLLKRDRRVANMHFEDYSINQYYQSLVTQFSNSDYFNLDQRVMEYMSSLTQVEMLIFNDISLYVDEFIEKYVKDIGNNMISMTFNNRYELVVTVNCITSIKSFGRGVDVNNCNVRWGGWQQI